MNRYEVTANFRLNHNSRDRTEWTGRVDACNREHALFLAGMRIVRDHPALVPVSLTTTVTRIKYSW